jgi:hypothetical protein
MEKKIYDFGFGRLLKFWVWGNRWFVVALKKGFEFLILLFNSSQIYILKI